MRQSWISGLVILISTDQIQANQVIGQAWDQSGTRRSHVVNISVSDCNNRLPVAGRKSTLFDLDATYVTKKMTSTGVKTSGNFIMDHGSTAWIEFYQQFQVYHVFDFSSKF